MSLKSKIAEDLKQALKSGDKTTVSVLRMVRSKILEKEVELRARKGRDYELSDDETTEVITSYAKQRKHSIQSYQEANRPDLASREAEELEILQTYLPRQLTVDEIKAVISEAVAETGASSMKDLGIVMRAVMPRLKGAADGKLVNQLVREHLG